MADLEARDMISRLEEAYLGENSSDEAVEHNGTEDRHMPFSSECIPNALCAGKDDAGPRLCAC